MAFECKSNWFELIIQMHVYRFLSVLISIEKRLAMELISRTMQDMQHNEIDQVTEVSSAEQSSTAANMNKYSIFRFCFVQIFISNNESFF